jgi:hypothetical protein
MLDRLPAIQKAESQHAQFAFLEKIRNLPSFSENIAEGYAVRVGEKTAV